MRIFLALVLATGVLFGAVLWLMLKAGEPVRENPCFYGCPNTIETSYE